MSLFTSGAVCRVFCTLVIAYLTSCLFKGSCSSTRGGVSVTFVIMAVILYCCFLFFQRRFARSCKKRLKIRLRQIL